MLLSLEVTNLALFTDPLKVLYNIFYFTGDNGTAAGLIWTTDLSYSHGQKSLGSKLQLDKVMDTQHVTPSKLYTTSVQTGCCVILTSNIDQ